MLSISKSKSLAKMSKTCVDKIEQNESSKFKLGMTKILDCFLDGQDN